jgi:hypothetical protein
MCCGTTRQEALDLEVIETIVAFNTKIFRAFRYPEDDGWAPVIGLMNPATFQMFSRDYYITRSIRRRKGSMPSSHRCSVTENWGYPA